MSIRLSDRELDVMAVLWARGTGTVTEVRESLGDPLAYTTVLTVLRTLEDKGFVGHAEEGKAHRYRPLVARERAGRSALSRMIEKLFEGSPELLVTQLVSDRKLSAEDIRRLRRILDERLREGAK
jgi:BlaI family transcriptional regulator, penicillinase repressor